MRTKVKVKSSLQVELTQSIKMADASGQKHTITFSTTVSPGVTGIKIYMPDGQILDFDGALVEMQ